MKVEPMTVEIDGVSKTLREWESVSGVHRDTIRERLAYGWDPKRAVFEPAKTGRTRNMAHPWKKYPACRKSE